MIQIPNDLVCQLSHFLRVKSSSSLTLLKIGGQIYRALSRVTCSLCEKSFAEKSFKMKKFFLSKEVSKHFTEMT